MGTVLFLDTEGNPVLHQIAAIEQVSGRFFEAMKPKATRHVKDSEWLDATLHEFNMFVDSFPKPITLVIQNPAHDLALLPVKPEWRIVDSTAILCDHYPDKKSYRLGPLVRDVCSMKSGERFSKLIAERFVEKELINRLKKRSLHTALMDAALLRVLFKSLLGYSSET